MYSRSANLDSEPSTLTLQTMEPKRVRSFMFAVLPAMRTFWFMSDEFRWVCIERSWRERILWREKGRHKRRGFYCNQLLHRRCRRLLFQQYKQLVTGRGKRWTCRWSCPRMIWAESHPLISLILMCSLHSRGCSSRVSMKTSFSSIRVVDETQPAISPESTNQPRVWWCENSPNCIIVIKQLDCSVWPHEEKKGRFLWSSSFCFLGMK